MIFGIRLGRIFRTIMNIGMGFLTGGPVGALMAGIKEFLPKILDKLPFAKFLKPALDFISGGGPMAFLSKGPMGLISSLAEKAGNLGNLSSFARGLMNNVGGHAAVDPSGMRNMTEIFAKNASRFV